MIFKYLSLIFPFSVLKFLTGSRTIFPFYHSIDENTPIFIKHLHVVKNKKHFNDDINFLLKHYSFITIDEIKKIINNKSSIPDNRFYLTFDDGLKTNIEIIAPELYRRGIPACFFINPNFIDNKDLSYKYKQSLCAERLSDCSNSEIKKLSEILNCSATEIKQKILSLPYKRSHNLELIANELGIDFNYYLEINKPYLTSDDIKMLINMGFEIGSHSLDHANFTELNNVEKQFQIEESFHILSSVFGVNYRLFAFPFSDFGVSSDFLSSLLSGNKVDILFSTSGMMEDALNGNIQRIWMESKVGTAKQLLKEEMAKTLIRKLIGRNHMKRT